MYRESPEICQVPRIQQLRRPAGSVFVDPGVARELEGNFSVLACLGVSWVDDFFPVKPSESWDKPF